MKIALIFDKQRPDTIGGYFERACQALGVAADQWWLRDAARIPAAYDLYLRIDHGDGYLVEWPRRLRPMAFYAVDTHLPHSWRKIRRLAGWCELVFCAQAEAARRLPNGVWLPLGCDPQLHAAPSGLDRRWDVAFVGTEGGLPRKFYLQALRERYPQSFIGAAEHYQLGKIYGQTRIGFNYSIADDVNMRTFEVLASGALLVTNALPHDNLARLGLEDRRHLVLYRHPLELFGVIDYYLAHRDERQRIADAGRELVLARHTYEHRMRELLSVVSRRLGIKVFSHHAMEAIACTSW